MITEKKHNPLNEKKIKTLPTSMKIKIPQPFTLNNQEHASRDLHC